jgi:hypothetical protein
MSYLKTAHAQGQADALATLGIKQATFVRTLAQKARALVGGAEHAGVAQAAQGLGHSHAIPRQGLASPTIQELGAKNLTAAGQVRNTAQTGFEAGLSRVRPAPVIPGASVKANPTRDVGSAVGQLGQLGGGLHPVGSADMLAALEGMSFEGLGNLTHAVGAAPVTARHSGVAAATPEMLGAWHADRAKWQGLEGAFRQAGAATHAPAGAAPRGVRLSDVLQAG